MVDRALLNHDVASKGVLAQIVLPGEAFDLVALALLELAAMPGSDLEFGSRS